MTAKDTVMAQVRRHGLTATDKAAIADAQNGCGICGRTEPGRKGWVIDHDRSCCSGDQSCLDCRRGVLCQWCNNALGYAFDNATVLRRMADYIEFGTRMHTSQVWSADRLTDQLTDQSTDSVLRIASAAPTQKTDGTYEEISSESATTAACVTRAGGAEIVAASSLASLGEEPRR